MMNFLLGVSIGAGLFILLVGILDLKKEKTEGLYIYRSGHKKRTWQEDVLRGLLLILIPIFILLLINK